MHVRLIEGVDVYFLAKRNTGLVRLQRSVSEFSTPWDRLLRQRLGLIHFAGLAQFVGTGRVALQTIWNIEIPALSDEHESHFLLQRRMC